MQENQKLKLSNYLRIMEHQEQIIVINRLNGQWVRLTKECYNILQNVEKNNLTIAEMYAALFDDDDREYMRSVVSALQNISALGENCFCERMDSISFSITHRCNLNCAHCMVSAQYGGNYNEIFNTDEMIAIMEKIVRAKPKSIILTGGEPLVRKDFFFLLEHLRSIYSGSIALMTNGTIFTEENIKKIVKSVDKIDISLDGADEESCAVVRGKGVFAKVINAIDLLHINGFKKISLSMVLTKNNYYFTEDFFQLNKKYNTFPMLRSMSYEGRAKENKELLDTKFTMREDIKHRNGDGNREIRACSCKAGYNQLTIEPNGDIFPCNLFVEQEYLLGNILDLEDLSTLLTNHHSEVLPDCLLIYEPDRFKKCRSCNIRYFCWTCLYQMKTVTDEDFEDRCECKKKQFAAVWKNINEDALIKNE